MCCAHWMAKVVFDALSRVDETWQLRSQKKKRDDDNLVAWR